MKQKPNLPFWNLWNLSFGFFGVQIAYALQSANISRIFATLGADPHSLSYFWILPPLMGILVQPIVGTLSDKTWTRWGRRIPYLFVGAAVAVLVMCLLPNSGSFGLTIGAALIFGLVALMFLDTSINMAMQPFKMLVGDMVNEEQKAKAYSIQSFLCNAGSVVGYVFPYVFAFVGISNVAAKGVIPDSVIWSFYIGAAILIGCVIYTTLKVKEWNPQEYAEYNGSLTTDSSPKGEGSQDKSDWITLLRKARARGVKTSPIGLHYFGKHRQLSGKLAWCSSSAGLPLCICGHILPAPLPIPYGIPLILPARTIRTLPTGWEFSLLFKLSVQ